jgi:Holliday junction resolvase RusA-like endonuclease
MLKLMIPYAPKPQGSKKAFVIKGRPVLVEASNGLKVRRAEFIAFIKSNLGGWITPTVDKPIAVLVEMVFERPKTVKRQHMTTTPDVDKTGRFVLDVLTQSGVVTDDRQVTDLTLIKRYGATNSTYIEVWERND